MPKNGSKPASSGLMLHVSASLQKSYPGFRRCPRRKIRGMVAARCRRPDPAVECRRDRELWALQPKSEEPTCDAV
jgi:hypothetical protein